MQSDRKPAAAKALTVTCPFRVRVMVRQLIRTRSPDCLGIKPTRLNAFFKQSARRLTLAASASVRCRSLSFRAHTWRFMASG